MWGGRGKGGWEANKRTTKGVGIANTFTGLNVPKNLQNDFFSSNHRLNMELDLQSLFRLLCTAVIIG
jgi:hypothetical protein